MSKIQYTTDEQIKKMREDINKAKKAKSYGYNRKKRPSSSVLFYIASIALFFILAFLCYRLFF